MAKRSTADRKHPPSSPTPRHGDASHWLGLAADFAFRSLGAEHRDRVARGILALDPASPYHVVDQ
jgi:hypothetical protein